MHSSSSNKTSQGKDRNYPCLGCQKNLEIFVEGERWVFSDASHKLVESFLSGAKKFFTETIQLHAVFLRQGLLSDKTDRCFS